jgi:hypothetical protein
MSPQADGSLSAGLVHLGLRRSIMLEMHPCRIDAMLTQSLDEAIANFDQLEKKYAVCLIEASEKLVAAKTEWAAHKMTCHLYCVHQLSRVH